MYKSNSANFSATKENRGANVSKLQSQSHISSHNNPKISSTPQTGLPSGTLRVQKKGVKLSLKPGSPQRYRQNFEINEVAANMNFQGQRKPFKMLNYHEEPNHSRSTTTIINEVNQSYQFVSALSVVPNLGRHLSPSSIDFSSELEIFDDSDAVISDFSLTIEEPKEREIYKMRINKQSFSKNSMFASTVEPKSNQNSELRLTPNKHEERFSTIYTLSSDSSARYVHTGHSDVPSPKVELNKGTCTTRFTTNTLENEIELYPEETDFKYERSIINTDSVGEISLGILPARTYCNSCAMDVSTIVRLELPTLSL